MTPGIPTLADAILDRFQLRRKTPAVSRAQWPERGTSGGYWASAPLRC